MPLIGAPTPDGLWQALGGSDLTRGGRQPPVKVAVNVWLRDRSLALSRAPPPRGGSGIQEAAAAAARQGRAEEDSVDLSSLGPLLLVLAAVGAGILGAGVLFDG